MSTTAHAAATIAGPETKTCLALYEMMVLIREFELAAQKLYKAGRIPGFIHLYVGEEAVATGICAHLRPDDWITSTHRGHGHALAKGLEPGVVLAELYGKATGCCGGRGGSMHLYHAAAGLFGTNGLVGGGIPACAGIALGAKTRRSGQVAVAFFGDGASNHGAFHEALNFAAVQNVPAIFVCENNLYATATPLTIATKNTDIASRAAAYHLPGITVDGNDVLAVWEAMRQATERARGGHGPTLIEARTYRTVGHHEGDPLVGTYRTQEELDQWKGRCPIDRFRSWLQAQRHVSEPDLESIETRVHQRLQTAIEFAESSPPPDPATANHHVWAEPVNPPEAFAPTPTSTAPAAELTWLEAVRDGIAEEMRRDPQLIYLGEGIGERGGSFAHTKGLWKEFGGHRVIDTPISELGFTGAALGASATGSRAVSDLMFADFLFETASQIVQHAAKLRYMSNGQIAVPMVIRAGMGAIKNAGPHHSGTYYPMWAHCPGLLVVTPSNPADAKGLMKSALRARDPVIFLEHKLLFGMKGQVPAGEHLVPLGQAAIVRAGRDLTVATCGALVPRCLEAASRLESDGLSVEVIDLRTIVPLDVDTVLESLARTGRLLIVDEAYPMCGIGAELAAAVMEQAFDELDAPVGRLHPDPVTQPFCPALENAIVVSLEKIVAAMKDTLAGRPPVPRRLKAQRPAPPAAPPSVAKTATAATAEGMGSTESTAPAKSAAIGQPILLPNQDLTVTEATILRWLKQPGEKVQAGESVAEVETAKSVFMVESPAAGVLAEILAPAGATIAVTAPIGTLLSH